METRVVVQRKQYGTLDSSVVEMIFDARTNAGAFMAKPLACGLFGRAVAAQELRQVLRKRGARQDHIASHFVRLLLQVSLDVGKKSNDGRSLFQLSLQLRNQGQRLSVDIVHVEDD